MQKNYQTTTRRARTGRTTPKKARLDAARAAHEARRRAARHCHRRHRRAGRRARRGPAGLRRGHRAQGARRGARVRGHRPRRRAGPPRPRAQRRCATAATPGWSRSGAARCRSRGPGCAAPTSSTEVQLPTYQLASSTELLGREAMAKMLAKLSTRRYQVGLEPMGEAVTAKSRSTSKSAVSRRFVAATESALAELMAADLSELDLVAIMVDGVHFAQHLCVVALGIGIDGTKHPLALVEGDTENATVVKRLLVGLRERGLDVTKPTLFVLDGAKALSDGGQGGLRPPGDRPVRRAQGQQRSSSSAQGRGHHRRAPHARRLPQPRPPGRPGRPRGAGHRARSLPSRRRRLACARGWPRRSPSAASASRRRWPARCARPTPSSR